MWISLIFCVNAQLFLNVAYFAGDRSKALEILNMRIHRIGRHLMFVWWLSVNLRVILRLAFLQALVAYSKINLDWVFYIRLWPKTILLDERLLLSVIVWMSRFVSQLFSGWCLEKTKEIPVTACLSLFSASSKWYTWTHFHPPCCDERQEI